MASRALSELKLLGITYNAKVQELQAGFLDQAKNPVFKEFLATRDPRLYPEAHQIILDEIEGRKIEFLSVLDLKGRVVVGGYANHTSQILDPDGLSLEVIGHPELEFLEKNEIKRDNSLRVDYVTKTVHHFPVQVSKSTLLPYREFVGEGAPIHRERKSEFSPISVDHMSDTEAEGLVRYVVTPIFADNSSSSEYGQTHADLLGVILAGDVVNGKVPIVEETIKSFKTGYSAVWYLSSSGEFVQAISYVGLLHGGVSTALAGFSFNHTQFLRAAYDAPDGQPQLQRMEVLGQQYTMAAQRLPDSGGGGSSSGSPVVLVRGTSDGDRLTTLRYSISVNVALVCGCLLVDCVVFASTLKSFMLPLQRIRQQFQARQQLQQQQGQWQHTTGNTGTGGSPAKPTARGAPISLSDLPTKRAFYLRAAGTDAVIVVAVVAMLVLQTNLVSDTLTKISSSESNVMSYLYHRKPEEMRLVARAQANNKLVLNVLSNHEAAKRATAAAATAAAAAAPTLTSVVGFSPSPSPSLNATSTANATNSSAAAFPPSPAVAFPAAVTNSSNTTFSSALPSTAATAAAALLLSSNSNSSAELRGQLQRVLFSQMSSQSVELGMLVDNRGRIIVNGNGGHTAFTRGAYFDPSNVVSSVLKSPKEVTMASVFDSEQFLAQQPRVYYEEVTDLDGRVISSGLDPASSLTPVLVRWVAVPVFLPSTAAQARQLCQSPAAADGVLLYGDIMNGKLGLPGRVQQVMGDGYSAVYLYDAITHDFTLATSVLSSGRRMESDVELGSGGAVADLLRRARESGTATAHLTLSGRRVPPAPYMVVVQSVSSKLVTDEYGQRTEEGALSTFLVRATPASSRDTIREKEVLLFALTLGSLLLVLAARAALTHLSFRPAQHLIQSLVNYGFLKAAEADRHGRGRGSGFSFAGNSRHSSSRHSSSSGGSSSDGERRREQWQGVQSFWRRQLARVVYHYDRLTWGFYLCALGMLLCCAVQLLQIQAPTSAGSADAAVAGGGGGAAVQRSGLAWTQDLFELARLGGDFIHETQKERGATAVMVGSGWSAANGSYSSFVAELGEQRALTNSKQGVFAKALAALDTEGREEAWVALVKQVKRKVADLRAHRQKVDRHGFDAPAPTAAFYTSLNKMILKMLFAATSMVHLADTFRLLYSYLVFMVMKEQAGRERANLAAWLGLASFPRPPNYQSFVDVLARKHEYHLRYFTQVAPPQYVRLFDRVTDTAERARVQAWEARAVAYPEALRPPQFPTAPVWFRNITAVIDRYHMVESAMRDDLAAVVTAHIAREEEESASRARAAAALAGCTLMLSLLFSSVRRLSLKKLVQPAARSRSRASGVRGQLRRAYRLLRWAVRANARPLALALSLAAVTLSVLSIVDATATASAAVRRMAALDTQLRFAAAAGDVLHESQKERGATAVSLGSNLTTFALELAAQRRNMDATLPPMYRRLAQLRSSAEVSHTLGDWVTQEQLADLKQRLDALTVHRLRVTGGESLDAIVQALASNHNSSSGSSSGGGGSSSSSSSGGDAAAQALLSRARSRKTTPTQGITYYTGLNRAITGALDSLSHLAADARMYRLIQSYVSVMLGKEIAGQTRAVFGVVLGAKKFTKATYNRVCTLNAQEAVHRHLLAEATPSSMARVWGDTVRGVEVDNVERWWALALQHPPAVVPPQFPEKGAHWYWNSTARINLMRTVDTAYRDALVADTARITAEINAQLLLVLLPQAFYLLLLFAASVLGYKKWRVRTTLQSSRQKARELHRNPLTAANAPGSNGGGGGGGGGGDGGSGTQHPSRFPALRPSASNNSAIFALRQPSPEERSVYVLSTHGTSTHGPSTHGPSNHGPSNHGPSSRVHTARGANATHLLPDGSDAPAAATAFDAEPESKITPAPLGSTNPAVPQQQQQQTAASGSGGGDDVDPLLPEFVSNLPALAIGSRNHSRNASEMCLDELGAFLGPVSAVPTPALFEGSAAQFGNNQQHVVITPPAQELLRMEEEKPEELLAAISAACSPSGAQLAATGAGAGGTWAIER